MKSKKWKKGMIAVMVTAAAAAAVIFVGPRVMGKNGAAVYAEVPVETRDITTYLEFSGNVEAVRVQNVYSDVSAKAVEVLVEKGDKVKKGDIIALLDSGDTEYNIALKEASLKLTKLQNSYSIKDSMASVDSLNEQIASGANSSLNSAQKALLTAQENYQDAADTYNKSKAEYETETADSIVSAKDKLQSAQLTYQLNMANLDLEKRKMENKKKSDEENQKKVVAENQKKAEEAVPGQPVVYAEVPDLTYEIYDTTYEEQKATYENTLAQAGKDLEDAKRTVKKQVDDDYAALLEAETALLEAEQDYETASLSVSQNVKSSQDALEKTQALANVESAEMELAHLKESLEDFTIYAPMDGFVTELNIKEGESVMTNAAAAEITDLSTMRAAIKIDEYDVGQVRVGDSVQVSINALGRSFEGKIASISKKAVIESNVSYLEAYVEFDAGDEVSSGLSAEIRLVKASAKDALSLPAGAIGYEADNTAYVLKKGTDGNPLKTYVTLGVTDGMYVQVKDGVNAGDMILMTPAANAGAASSGLMIGGGGPVPGRVRQNGQSGSNGQGGPSGQGGGN